MNLAATIRLYAYGTSEGALKGWDTRGRGQKEKPYEEWSQEEKNRDWAERHRLPIDNRDRVRLYHATPLSSVASISKAGLRSGSFLTDDKETALHQAGRERGLKAGKLAIFEAWVPLGSFYGTTWAQTMKDLSVDELSLKRL